MAIKLGSTPKNLANTLSAYNDLINNRNGGGFLVLPTRVTEERDPVSAVFPTRYTNPSSDFKPFIISIYNQQRDEDVLSLVLMVNPSDISIGQTFVSSDGYTRQGWLSTLWGSNQKTINANCSSAGFYVGGTGVTNFNRHFSVAFKNFITVVGLFKNNGYYPLRGDLSKDMFGINPGRVISVMDQIKISYDDVDYLGSFSALTIDESAEMPYRIKFNFEFIVSGLRGDEVEGHMRYCNGSVCNDSAGIKISIQGFYNNQDILDPKALQDSAFTNELEPVVKDPLDKAASTEAEVLRRSGGLTITKARDLTGTTVSANVLQYRDLIEENAKKYGIPAGLLAAQMGQESAGVKDAVSRADAKGLMQIIPSTGKDLGLTTEADFFDPEKNVDAGARYLSQQLKTFDGDVVLALSAYNAGPGNVRKYKGVPPFKETQDYVKRILSTVDYYTSVLE